MKQTPAIHVCYKFTYWPSFLASFLHLVLFYQQCYMASNKREHRVLKEGVTPHFNKLYLQLTKYTGENHQN